MQIHNAMKILFYSFFSTIFLSLLSFSLHAQNAWNLQQCIEYSLDHNIDLKINELQVNLQEDQLLQSKLQMLPSLNANGNYVENWGKAVDRYTNEFADARTKSINFYVQTQVTLFNGFQLLNTVKKNNFMLEAQKQNLNYNRDMKAMEITTAFLQILYDKENLTQQKQQVSYSQMQVERTSALVEAGSVPKGDLFNIQSQLATEQAGYIEAENKLNMNFLSLKQLLFLPADTVFDIYAPQIELTGDISQIPNPFATYEYALGNRPEIKNAEYQLLSSETDLKIAKGAISPNLSFGGSLGSGYSGANVIQDGTPTLAGFQPTGDYTSAGDTVITPIYNYSTKSKPFIDQVFDNRNISFGLYLSVPIFNGWSTNTSISQSKIAQHQAELQLEKSKVELRQTIEQAHADARSAMKQYEASKLQVDALEEAFKYAEQRFEARTITAFEYNDAKTKLLVAQGNLINSKYNYIFRVKILDFYNGRPLSL